MIPAMDLRRQYRQIKNELAVAINRVFKGSSYILGEEVRSLEKEFAAYLGVKYAVGVNSGTDALFLALKACGIGKNDEVITCAFGYIASVLGISYCGAKPVLVDMNEQDYNIDVTKLEKAITSRTKAILPVHLYGQMCDMVPLLRLAREYKLKVIEDCAQAHGAEIQLVAHSSQLVGKGSWKKAGTIGDVGCYSFYPTKNMGAYGDGGMLVTNNKKIYQQLLLLRDYGRKDRYEFALKGYNSRLDEIQAAMLRVKLRHLGQWNKKRQQAASLYQQKIKYPDLLLPLKNPGRNHVYHLFVIRTAQRKQLQEYLQRQGVGTAIHYPLPIHLQEAYRDLPYKKGSFPAAEQAAQEVLSLPMFPELKKSEILTVCQRLNNFKR
ncbi:MAG: DegT/DnrJ/EryC1/StrS family aminotransferase [bacterium]|nr:DegT/DnrJ/EryC1/StrS family aminotransferase [bacterium]MDD5354467.1 DegT/DnrJ/EryC1/StrS family aminotransferase [bacterium]MDD5755698.1 DegT/DnrJ/EryC1/StrS family aminotransferase [bacterium]